MNADKMNGVGALSAYFDIPAENIAAFGDDYSDIAMIRGCGMGVAVANAIEEVRNAADYICGDNDGDGVANWLWANVL
jgi:hydroxymethylpyrimidine pyrophosphatase-like HAD family hydrolase